jgi:high affinity Mn2+ porin
MTKLQLRLAKLATLIVLACAGTSWAIAQDATAIPSTTPPVEQAADVQEQAWNWHVQNTDILQGHPGFPADYSGANSLDNHAGMDETVSMDLYAGLRLWPGAEAHVDGLMWQGYGLSSTEGVEDFPNGEAVKVGTGVPNGVLARLFIRQTIGLGGEQEDVADGQLTLAGQQDVSRITITAGRFSATDIFDNNSYAGDPRTQFMNWAFLANAAWDYPMDTVGYTTGLAVELNQPQWTLRYGFFQEPGLKNGFTEEDQLLKWPQDDSANDGPFFHSWAMVTEFEYRYTIDGHPGAIRPLAWLNEADMASYSAATALLLANPNNVAGDIAAARAYRLKFGFGLNWEQEIAKDVGLFSRAGWNDGHEEAWTFTDANWSASLGVSVKGSSWGRPGDTFGLAGVVSGASSANQKFLEAGGTDILDGDGALSYSPEEALETYYNFQIREGVSFTLDYQLINHPAFNTARGPVSVFGARLHLEY